MDVWLSVCPLWSHKLMEPNIFRVYYSNGHVMFMLFLNSKIFSIMNEKYCFQKLKRIKRMLAKPPKTMTYLFYYLYQNQRISTFRVCLSVKESSHHSWSNVIALGKHINTISNDQSQYVHSNIMIFRCFLILFWLFGIKIHLPIGQYFSSILSLSFIKLNIEYFDFCLLAIVSPSDLLS